MKLIRQFHWYFYFVCLYFEKHIDCGRITQIMHCQDCAYHVDVAEILWCREQTLRYGLLILYCSSTYSSRICIYFTVKKIWIMLCSLHNSWYCNIASIVLYSRKILFPFFFLFFFTLRLHSFMPVQYIHTYISLNNMIIIHTWIVSIVSWILPCLKHCKVHHCTLIYNCIIMQCTCSLACSMLIFQLVWRGAVSQRGVAHCYVISLSKAPHSLIILMWGLNFNSWKVC